MRKEMIMKQAMETNSTKDELFFLLRRDIMSDASSSDPTGWDYDAVKKEFHKCFKLWGAKKIMYTELEKEEDGIRMLVAYDFHEEYMYGNVYIPENTTSRIVTSLIPKLQEKRKVLHKRWKENAKNVISNYFEINAEDFLKFPLAFANGFRTKSFILWNCYKSKEDADMVEKLGVLTNQFTETLDDQYFFPCFWESVDDTEADVLLGNYVLHISRNFAPDLNNFNYDWPEVRVCFEIVHSEKSEWKNALDVIRYFKENEKQRKYKEFREDLTNKADWMIRYVEGKREAYAYIPIIYSEYAEYICKEAKEEYRGEIQVRGICKRYVPFYDHEEMTCIEVVVSE